MQKVQMFFSHFPTTLLMILCNESTMTNTDCPAENDNRTFGIDNFHNYESI